MVIRSNFSRGLIMNLGIINVLEASSDLGGGAAPQYCGRTKISDWE
jgi:hypothetical protein